MKEKLSFLLSAVLTVCLYSCSSKPSEKEISQKLLLDYVCRETAKVNHLKILRTEKTESTGQPTIFHFSVSGEVEWPTGCTEFGTNTPPGTKEKFERLVTLYETENGSWE